MQGPHNSTPLPLLAAALLLLAVPTQGTAAACDCNDIRLLPTDVPVRGADGLVYASACMAKCQGVQLASSGVSAAAVGSGPSSGDALPFHPSQLDPSRPLGRADMDRFKAEGFRLAARIKLRSGAAWKPQLLRRAGAKGAGAARHGMAASRVTEDGLLYLLPASLAAQRGAGSVAAAGVARTSSGPFPGTLPNPTAANSTRRLTRKLLQPVGTDERTEVTTPAAHAFPWRAVGYLASGCSGALIAPKTVLTAGHCVYDTEKRVFYDSLNFSPGRHDGGRHCERRRRGRCVAYSKEMIVGWAHVTTWFSNAGPPVQCDDGSFNCQTQQDFAWDIALVTLKRAVGNQLGWLGFGYQCATTTYAVTSAGYPADLDNTMSHMYTTSGTLNPFSGCLPKDDPSGVISSDLDTAPGQSGSAIWDGNYYVRAIHNSGGPGTAQSSRTIMTGSS